MKINDIDPRGGVRNWGSATAGAAFMVLALALGYTMLGILIVTGHRPAR